MKSKKAKRIFSWILAISMLVSLVGCVDGGNGEGNASPGADGGAGTTNTAAGPLTPYEETVKITWAVQTSAVQQFFDGDTYDDNIWSRLIKEKLNIDVEVAFSADISTDAYRNKMSVLLASGGFPDVVRWSDRTFFKQAYEAGYITSIQNVFDDYASDAVKAYQTQFADSFAGASIDGQLAAFPYMDDNFHQASYLWIRDDWLENTNSKAPKTVEEMVELAKKFTFEDPDGNGIDDTYGFAMQKNVVQSNYGTILGMLSAYGVPGYGESGIFYRGDDGKMTFGYLQPAVKDALAVIRGMYEDGLIDPEFVVHDVSTLETDIASGKIGMMYHMNWGDWHPFNISYQADGVITRPYPIPTVEGIDPKFGLLSNQTGDLFMISADCENPEALIKILNLYQEMAIDSSNPEDFQKYWANEQYRLCPIYVGIPTELYAPVLLEALEKGSPEGLSGTPLQYYNYVVGFEDKSLAEDTNAYGTWGQMNAAGSMAIALDYQAKGYDVINVMANDIPDVWMENSSTLSTMVTTAFTDIIVGNQPLDSFDTFVENWLTAGGQATLEALEELYPAS